MKKLFLFLVLLLPALTQAQIIPTLPVTLTNGTLADANQVMSDFNTIVTGVNTNGAKNGSNSDITALNSLTTPITPAQGGSSVYTGNDSGAANAYVVTATTPTNYTLRSGNTVNFIPLTTNNGPSTLAAGGTTAVSVLRQTSAGLQPLVGGEIFGGQVASAIYDGVQYELLNSAVSSNVQPCTSIDYAGITVPTGYLAEDGTTRSRTAFAALFGCLSLSVPATTASGSANPVVANSALFQVGWFVGGPNVTCNSVITAIPDSTHVTLNNQAGATGSTTLTIGPFRQGDCSTTFNLPGYNGRATVMTDNSGSVLTSTTCTNPATIGSICGSQTKTIANGNLPASIPYNDPGHGHQLQEGSSTGAVTLQPQVLAATGLIGAASSGAPVQTTTTGITINQGGANTPISSLAPIALVTKAIKF